MSTFTAAPWSLDDLFTARDSQEMKLALNELETTAKKIELHREMLSSHMTVSDFLKIVKELEDLYKLAYRVHSFASLSFAADTQDQGAQSFLAQVQQIVAGIENRILFFSLWWKDLEKDSAKRFIDAAGDYRYWLEQMRLFKPHTLTEAEEKIINIKNITGASALQNLYDSITNRYIFHLDVDGEEKELTRGEIMVYARGHNPDLRRAAYQEIYRIYGQEGPILGQIYQTLVRDWKNEQVDLRSFSSPMAARNLSNDIPDPVVETLLDVSKQNAPLFQRYFRLKARMLQMDRLRRYDIYAPVAKADKTYSFNAAADMVLTSFSRFDPKLEALARRVFDMRHLDSEVRPGKRSGAFCMTVTPDLTPWVLVNYQGKAEDVATLAHELGHAIHSMLAEHHSLFTQHSSLPLAETASTFGEMMLVDRLLDQEDDKSVRRDLLFKQVDDSYSTIMRQIYFALFERQSHEMIMQGASVDELANTYIENLEEQFGDSIEVSEEFRWEWVSIPHIYQMPFYVYAYAFGQLLVLSLYRQFKAEGEVFKPRYLDILSAGGSEAPVQILSKAGIDVSQAEFWQAGFDEIARLIDQLESMVVIKD
jgi:oligoendopeptidase F